jgi:hypothetical protein
MNTLTHIFRKNIDLSRCEYIAWVAELVDARDLKFNAVA